MNDVTTSVPYRAEMAAFSGTECFSFCPTCLTREFFQAADRDHSWMHCSRRRTALRFIDCPVCARKFEFLGQSQCPFCHAAYASGIPLPPKVQPKNALDRLLKSRGAARDLEKQRAASEFAALYASWRQEIIGLAQACSLGETRFGNDLGSVRGEHDRLLAEFAGDIEKFLYGAPIRLAKFESEYSWKFDQELEKEIDQVLEGMLSGKHAVPASLPFLARCRQRLPQAYSRDYLQSELKRRFHERRLAPRPGFQLTLEYARSLTGLEFEEWLARLLREGGIQGVCVTQASRDQGADLVITIGSRKIVMQAKQYQDTIGNSAVQQVHGALPYYGASEAWVVTTSTFSRDAIDLAFRTGVRLVSGNQLLNLPAMLLDGSPGNEMPLSDQGASAALAEHLPSAVVVEPLLSDTSPAAPVSPIVTGKIQNDLQKLTRVPVFRNWKQRQVFFAAGSGVLVLILSFFLFMRSERSHSAIQTITPPQVTNEIRDLLLNKYRTAELQRSPSLLAQCYAPTVQTFYLHHNVPRADVQTEFERAFATYTDVRQIDFSGLEFRSLGPNQVMADFEKTWDLRGQRNYAGAEREEMVFRKVDGSWRIVSERELKIYWTKRTKAPAL